MKCLLLLFPLFFCSALAVGVPVEDRVAGGVLAPISRFPYMVSFTYSNYYYNGQGAIVSRTVVVTSAILLRQLVDVSLITVQYGTDTREGGFDPNVRVREIHYVNRADINQNDLAIVILRSRLVFGDNVRPVRLPSRRETFLPAESCIVSGWGAEREGGGGSTLLRAADVTIIDRIICTRTYPALGSKQICAGEGRIGACLYDQGSPLVCRGTLAGIFSYVNNCDVNSGVYTYIPPYVDIIKKHIGKDKDNSKSGSDSNQSG